ncbi:hypothetical protein HZH66_011547 [Vespula vulgaris]|uniref:AMP-dependent synthetase/ligase domain-containing protein n=1 Tax=Vespula vulgaris TaxID=7454 RepID=A0A834JCX1_VESVU|nr:hypothetical protein HZH66_011547 [Vespula vulgaris]
MWSLYAFPILWTVLHPFFAIFCEAAIFTPWNSTMDIREARYFMKLSGAKIVFADENSSSKCFIFSDILKGYIKFDVDNFQCTSVDSIHDIAELLYSSGTTNLSKRIRISHFSFLSNELLSDDFNTEGILFWLLPYFWVSGVLLTLNSIVNYYNRLLYPTFEEEMMSQKSHHKADSVGTVGKNAQIKIVDLKTRCALGPNKIDELLRK